jgi:hypothetical protein
LCFAFLVERAFVQLIARMGGIFVGIAEDEAGQLLRQRILVALGIHHAEQTVAGGRRAIQIPAGDIDLHAAVDVQRGIARIELEFHPFGQKLFDVETHDGCRQLGRRISTQLQPPRAGRRIGRQLDGTAVVAGELFLRLPGGRPLRLAVRSTQDGL